MDMRNLIEVSRKLINEIKRSEMPQIKTQDVPNALKKLRHDGISVVREDCALKKIKPIQDKCNREKIDRIKEDITEPFMVQPIILSNDYHIVDGHHRWAALKEKFGEESYVPSFVVGLPAASALKKYAEISDNL